MPPQINTVWYGSHSPLIDTQGCLWGSVTVLGISKLFPIPKAQRVLCKECIIHLSKLCNIALHTECDTFNLRKIAEAHFLQ